MIERASRLTQAWLARWPATALDVALTRIVVASLLAFTSEVEHAVVVASGPKGHLVAPDGLGWFLQAAPIDVGTAKAVRLLHYNAAALSAVGLFTRPMLVLLCATSFYLLGLNQLSGSVLHDMHLLWFAALLAVSAPAEALSVDAWFAGEGGSFRQRLLGDARPAAKHALTVASIGSLLGVVYFFPGAWKLGASGLGWAWSDNLAHQMHAKWLEYGVVPWPRVDRVPWLLEAGATAALLFELGFFVLVQRGPRTRMALAAAGLAFHLSIQHFLLIPFSALWLCYVALVPWHRLLPVGPPSATQAPGRGTAMVFVVCALLLIERGVRGRSQSFPFACYPTFHLRMGGSLQDLRVVAEDAAGDEREVPVGRDEHGRRSQAAWGTVWSVAGIYGAPFREARLLDYLRAERQRPGVTRALQGAARVRVELVLRDTDPDAWGQPPRLVRVLYTWTP